MKLMMSIARKFIIDQPENADVQQYHCPGKKAVSNSTGYQVGNQIVTEIELHRGILEGFETRFVRCERRAVPCHPGA